VTSLRSSRAELPAIPLPTTDHVRAVMRGNRSRNTKPELAVRRLLWALGYRYRVHRRDLPGTPDIVLGARKKAIFVHGCFWHQHKQCRLSRPLRSNLAYWSHKLSRNKARDTQNLRHLRALGWTTLIVWECQVSDSVALTVRLTRFLRESPSDS
jgi:DNA mismatch endonuclease, patch repair protein